MGRTPVFDTHQTLHTALTTSGTFNGLYTALMASTPPLAVRTHADHQVTGLEFSEPTARIRNSPISGSVTINPDSGAIVLQADGYPGPRWYAALERLATNTAPWSWQPDPEHKPGALAGVLRLGAHLNAETAIDRSSHHADQARAGLALIPANRETCHTAWALAVTVLGALVTDDPAYRSTVLPAPDPETLTGPTAAPGHTTTAPATWIFSYAMGLEVDHGPVIVYATAPDYATASDQANARIDAYTATLDTSGDRAGYECVSAVRLPTGTPPPVPEPDTDWQTILHTPADEPSLSTTPEFPSVTLDHPQGNTSADGLSGTTLTDAVKTLVTAHGEPSQPAPGSAPAPVDTP
jgi:hypothetical protein